MYSISSYFPYFWLQTIGNWQRECHAQKQSHASQWKWFRMENVNNKIFVLRINTHAAFVPITTTRSYSSRRLYKLGILTTISAFSGLRCFYYNNTHIDVIIHQISFQGYNCFSFALSWILVFFCSVFIAVWVILSIVNQFSLPHPRPALKLDVYSLLFGLIHTTK